MVMVYIKTSKKNKTSGSPSGFSLSLLPPPSSPSPGPRIPSLPPGRESLPGGMHYTVVQGGRGTGIGEGGGP
jgi:hypothetical protein